MSKKLSVVDYETFKKIVQTEQDVHKRVIDLAYNKINIANEEKQLDIALEQLMHDRHQMNTTFEKNYGRFKSFDPQTGEYTLVDEDIADTNQPPFVEASTIEDEPQV